MKITQFVKMTFAAAVVAAVLLVSPSVQGQTFAAETRMESSTGLTTEEEASDRPGENFSLNFTEIKESDSVNSEDQAGDLAVEGGVAMGDGSVRFVKDSISRSYP